MMELEHTVRLVALYAIPGIFAITLHEAAHGYAARHFGDLTAYQAGRITLNPIRHIDLMGTIVIPILILIASQGKFAFGWAKPVPVDFGRLHNPKRDMLWVAAAGPWRQSPDGHPLDPGDQGNAGRAAQLLYRADRSHGARRYHHQCRADGFESFSAAAAGRRQDRGQPVAAPPCLPLFQNRAIRHDHLIVLMFLGVLNVVMLPFVSAFIAVLASVFNV
jgi:hypothetical protein